MNLMSELSSSNQSNVGTSRELEKFPSNGRETADFRDWLFKNDAVFLSRNMLDVVNEPIVGFPSNEVNQMLFLLLATQMQRKQHVRSLLHCLLLHTVSSSTA